MATGATITSRMGHTAVLNKKGEIIIYGGVYSISLVASDPSIAVLNTTTNPYQWSIPSVNTSEVNPPNLIFHTANLVKNYMIVAFGNITKTAIYEELPGQSDQLYILDINTFTWVRTFNPPINNLEPTSANESQSNNTINTIMIILIVVAVVLIVSQQVTASQIDADSIFTSKSNVGVPRDMQQFNRDIKQHQYIASILLPSETSSVTNHYARDSKDGDINDTNHYTINNNTTHQYGEGNNNIAHHSGDNNQYATDTNIAPAHETFNVSPDQPFGVVMLNTQSGEMIISNYNNYNNYNYRFSNK
ncbi:hypothetical protein C1645_836210 [Glomus cerebriforme]|uniref:Galactose oxidase n=1 Tax=Glomus cerebriforme TaxID=658196 RepID=A0A397S688_9GLOM|nr:hypothetical protein C1645_836210 [Glomus cerebriforme]